MNLIYNAKDLVIFQSRYAQNNFQGNSRWVVTHPEKKLFFGAIGKDDFPPALDVLRLASKEGVPKEERFRSLLENGLLSETYSEDSDHGYLHRYHSFVRNYPFNDYSSPQRWHKDREQMAEYGKIELPPPQYTCLDDHPGQRVNLPIPLFRRSTSTDADQATTEISPSTAIATALAATFQATGSIDGGDFGPWLRKACPSGGARHPTEAKVLLHGIDGIPDGVWLYDATRHQLIRDADLRPEDKCQAHRPWVQWAFVSRVERPMWRYREARSMRPVLIDAGHVIRNVKQYLRTLGYDLLRDERNCRVQDFDFTTPTVANYLMTGPGLYRRPQTECQLYKSTELDHENSYATNPLVWLSVSDGHLKAHSDWPFPIGGYLSKQEFRILNYCIPSKRGDRPSQAHEITDSLKLTDTIDINRLVQSGWLISNETLKSVESKVEKWCRSNWYPSLLAWININASRAILTDIPFPEPGPQSESQKLHELRTVSMKRKTTRNFEDTPLAADEFEDLVEKIASSENFSNSPISGRLAYFSGDTAPLYQIQKSKTEKLTQIDVIERSTVVSNGIGQFPLKKASIVLWLYTKVDCSDPNSYCDQLLKLGEIGQDICFHCAQSGVGVFLTPAVVDDPTREMLSLPATGDYFFYLFAFGKPASAAQSQKETLPTIACDLSTDNETYFQLNSGMEIVISKDGKVRRLKTDNASQ